MSTAASPSGRVSTRTLVVAGALVALVIAGFVSFYASGKPDGLEYVAGQQGLLGTAPDSRTSADSPLADYRTEGVDDARASGAVAGITGTVLVLVLAGGAGLLLRRRGAAGDPL